MEIHLPISCVSYYKKCNLNLKNTIDAVFITGGTGYMGKRLVKILLDEGIAVTALIRQQSLNKLPVGGVPVNANPFSPASHVNSIPEKCTFIHLLGVSHPGPKKKALFIQSISLH